MSEEAKDVRKRGSGAGKITNAEEFANYVHAVSIPMKVVMAAIVVFFAGAIAFCVFGKVPVTIDCAASVDETGTCTCYVKADDRSGIEPGDSVEINSGTYYISGVSSTATCVDETIDSYVRELGSLEIGDYVFLVTVYGNLSPGAYSATLVKDHLQPLSVLLSG